MSAGAISLESAIRTCKVNVGWANKIESDRFLNPNMMVCPIWNGVDQFQREVCPDSYYTKRAGCNSAEDRVMVENAVSRPQYIEYLPLSANGVKGHIYDNTMAHANSSLRNHQLSEVHQVAGSTGNQYGAEIQVSCGSGRRGNPGAYKEAMTHEANQSRMGQAMQHGHGAYKEAMTHEANQSRMGQAMQHGHGAYKEAMAHEANQSRMGQAMQHGYGAYNRRQDAGF